MTNTREERVATLRRRLGVVEQLLTGTFADRDGKWTTETLKADILACLEPSPDVWEAIRGLLRDFEYVVTHNIDGRRPEFFAMVETYRALLPDPPKVTVEEPIAPKRD